MNDIDRAIQWIQTMKEDITTFKNKVTNAKAAKEANEKLENCDTALTALTELRKNRCHAYVSSKSQLSGFGDYAGGWISVKKELPKPGTQVLIAYKFTGPLLVDLAALTINGDWLYFNGLSLGKEVCGEVVFWMPTPTPPDQLGGCA